MRFAQGLAHLFPSVGDEKFGATGKEKQRTNSDTCRNNTDPLQRMQFVDEGSYARHRARLKLDSRAVNGLEKIIREVDEIANGRCFLQPICFTATNFVKEKTSCQNHYW